MLGFNKGYSELFIKRFDVTILQLTLQRLCAMRIVFQMVDQMENRVYVQMEKDAQTAADHQFLFVCQLADAKDSKERG